jgi:hypothetical protein
MIDTEILKELINANQVAIKQLGKDIVNLEKKIRRASIQTQNEIGMMRRDIQDRWQYISDMTKTFEEAMKVQKHDFKKTKNQN